MTSPNATTAPTEAGLSRLKMVEWAFMVDDKKSKSETDRSKLYNAETGLATFSSIFLQNPAKSSLPDDRGSANSPYPARLNKSKNRPS